MAIHAVFGTGMLMPRIVFTCIRVLMVLLGYLFASEMFRSRRIGLVSAALMAVYAPLLQYSGRVISEGPFTAMLLAGLLFTLRAMRGGRSLDSVAAGIAFGAATYVRGTGFCFAILIFVGSVWLLVKGNRNLSLRLGLISLMAVLVVSPWVYRNWVYTGRPVLMSSNLGQVLYAYHNPETWNDTTVLGVDRPRDEMADALVPPEEVSRIVASSRSSEEVTVRLDRIKQQKAVEYIRENVPRELVLSWYRFLAFYQLRGSISGNPAKWAALAQVWLVELLAVVGLVLLRRYSDNNGRLVFALLLPLAMHFLLAYSPRYRLPLDPFIAILAALAITHAFHSLTQSWNRRRGADFDRRAAAGDPQRLTAAR